MYQVLQWLGGGFYLLNKIFFSFFERTGRKLWDVASWAIYIAGLPPWVIIFIKQNNVIAGFVEASCLPSMILGLVNSIRGGRKSPPLWLMWIARIAAAIGFAYSFKKFKGFHVPTQWLETALVIGFLVGTYRLAKKHGDGYLWYILMHIACGWLMWIQFYEWLALQQLISLAFIVDAYLVTQRRRAANS